MTLKDKILLEERSRAGTLARVSKLYEESNSGTGKEDPRTLLDRVQESNPGFGERISAALDAGHEAVYDLTLRDIIDHIRLGHLDERVLEYDLDRMDANIRTISRKCRMFDRYMVPADSTPFVRAQIAGWIACTVGGDLGLELPDSVSMKGPSPGFRERMAAVLDTKENEAALSLTLHDVWDHAVLSVRGQIVVAELYTDNLFPDIRRMVEAVSKKCGVCRFCGRAAVVRWIARSLAQVPGPHTALDPLAPFAMG